jgi:hypothetical protein
MFARQNIDAVLSPFDLEKITVLAAKKKKNSGGSDPKTLRDLLR